MASLFGVGLAAASIGALVFSAAGARAAPAAHGDAHAFDLKAGQEITFPVTVEGGRVVLGVPRRSKLGSAEPKAGEITVGLTPGDKDLIAHVIAKEKTAVPIDFVATGLNGEIKIDERVVCGRLGEPTSTRIGSVPWRVSLNSFEVGKGEACP